VSAGTDFTCAIDSTLHLQCWGINLNGQTSVPNKVSNDNVMTVTAGDSHACAVQQVGKITCWGKNNDLDNIDRKNNSDKNKLNMIRLRGISLGTERKNQLKDSNEQNIRLRSVPNNLFQPLSFHIQGVKSFRLSSSSYEVC